MGSLGCSSLFIQKHNRAHSVSGTTSLVHSKYWSAAYLSIHFFFSFFFFLTDIYDSKIPLFSFVSPTLCFLVWLSDAFVEHFTQVWYTRVWNIILLVFQTMTTPRKDSPLSIQEDMSMHSASSFHRRKCLNTTLESQIKYQLLTVNITPFLFFFLLSSLL